MDSRSQLVLGAAVPAALAPPRHRRAALAAGAALGTLPDLDVLLINAVTADPVLRMSWHRGVSHSLFLLPLLGWALWWFFRRRGGRVAEAPRPWLWAIVLALCTHPLLDALTVYGTQLWWPLPLRPVMGSSVFIIDPAYTVWLLLACALAWFARERALAQRALLLGLALSTAYLGWSLGAKLMVERAASAALAPLGLAEAPRFSTPLPFNTLLWRVVVMTPEGYWEAERSVFDRGPMRFAPHASDGAALAAVAGAPAVRQLTWFNHGFMRAQDRDGTLVLSDLRMGLEPDYTFNFAVARRGADGRWQPQPPQRVPTGPGAALSRDGLGALWRHMRQRIAHEPLP